MDHYEILGIDKSASQADIKKAYRDKAKINHPDKGGNEETFKKIASAYEILSDPDKRKHYDRFGDNPPSNQPQGFNMHDFMRQYGFGRQQRVRHGHDISLDIKLTLEEIFSGVNKQTKYRRDDSCTTCDGKGGTGQKQCPICNGQGVIYETVQTNMGVMQSLIDCRACSSTGIVTEHNCKTCNGNGVLNIEETIDIVVPHGVQDGLRYVMDHKGHAIKNGIAGRLIIKITELAHKNFVRNNNDLRYYLKLTYPQLILGDKIEIPTIDGNKVRVTIPEYTKVGDNLKLSNKGMKAMNSDNRGDMILILEIDIPSKISDKEKELIIKLKDLKQ